MRQKSNLSAVVPKSVRAKFAHKKYSTRALIAGYTIGILVLAGVGVLFQNATAGNLLILIFGIVAVTVFVNGLEIIKMMIITLICAMILTLTKNHELANVFAQYSFLFLIIAMVNILREEYQRIRKPVDK
jgi:hypothetical protein